MELKILHFYPDLMSLYGSYANVSILKRWRKWAIPSLWSGWSLAETPI